MFNLSPDTAYETGVNQAFETIADGGSFDTLIERHLEHIAVQKKFLSFCHNPEQAIQIIKGIQLHKDFLDGVALVRACTGGRPENTEPINN